MPSNGGAVHTELKYHPNASAVARHVPATKFPTAQRFRQPKADAEPDSTAAADGSGSGSALKAEAEAAAAEEAAQLAAADADANRRLKLVADARRVKRAISQQLIAIRTVLTELQALNSETTYTATSYERAEQLLFAAREKCRAVETHLRSERVQHLITSVDTTATAAPATDTATATGATRTLSAVEAALAAADASDDEANATASASNASTAAASTLSPAATPSTDAAAAAAAAAAHARFLLEEEEEFGGTDLGRERAAARERAAEAERQRKAAEAELERTIAAAAQQRAEQNRLLAAAKNAKRTARAQRKRAAADRLRAYAELVDTFVAVKHAVEAVATDLLRKHKMQLDDAAAAARAARAPATTAAGAAADDTAGPATDADRERLAAKVYAQSDLAITKKRIPAASFGRTTARASTPADAPAETSGGADSELTSPLMAVRTCIEALAILQSKLANSKSRDAANASDDDRIPQLIDHLSRTLNQLQTQIVQLTSAAESSAPAPAAAAAAAAGDPTAAAVRLMNEQMPALEGSIRECIELLTLLLTQSDSESAPPQRLSGRASSFAARPYGSEAPAPAAAETTRTEQILSQLAQWSADSTSEHRKAPASSFGKSDRFPKSKLAKRQRALPREYRHQLTPSESAPIPNLDAVRPHVPGAIISAPTPDPPHSPRTSELAVEDRVRMAKRKAEKQRARIGPGAYDTAEAADGIRKHVPGVTIVLPTPSTTAVAAAKRNDSGARVAPGGYNPSDALTAPRVPSGLIAPEPTSVSIKPRPKRVVNRRGEYVETNTPAPVDPTLPVRPHQPSARIGPPPSDETTDPVAASSAPRRAAERLLRRVMRERYAAFQIAQQKRDAVSETKKAAAAAAVNPSPAFAPRVGPEVMRHPHVPYEVRKAERERPLPPADLPGGAEADRHKPAFAFAAPDADALETEKARRRIAVREARAERERNYRIRPELEAPPADEPVEPRPTLFSAHTGRSGQSGATPVMPPELEPVKIFTDPHNPVSASATKPRSRHTTFSTAESGRGGSVIVDPLLLDEPRAGDVLILKPNPDAARIASVGTRAHSFSTAGRADSAPLSAAELEAIGLGDGAPDGQRLKLDVASAHERLRKRVPAHGFATANDSDHLPGTDLDQPTLILSPNRSAIEARARAAVFAKEETNRLKEWKPDDELDTELILHPSDEATRRRRPSAGFGSAPARQSAAESELNEFGSDGSRLILYPQYTQIDANVPNVDLTRQSRRPASTIEAAIPAWASGGPAPEIVESENDRQIRADLLRRSQRGIAWQRAPSDTYKEPEPPTPGPGSYSAASANPWPAAPYDPAGLIPVSSVPGPLFSPTRRTLISAPELPLASAPQTALSIDEQHTKKGVPAVGFTKETRRGIQLNASFLAAEADPRPISVDYSQIDPHTPHATFGTAIPDRLMPTEPVPYETALAADMDRATLREPRATDFRPHPAASLPPHPPALSVPSAAGEQQNAPTPKSRPPPPKLSPRERLDILLDSMISADHQSKKSAAARATASTSPSAAASTAVTMPAGPPPPTAIQREQKRIEDVWYSASASGAKASAVAAKVAASVAEASTVERASLLPKRRSPSPPPVARRRPSASASDRHPPTDTQPHHLPVHSLLPVPSAPAVLAPVRKPARARTHTQPPSAVPATAIAKPKPVPAAALKPIVIPTTASVAVAPPVSVAPPPAAAAKPAAPKPKPIIKLFGVSSAASSAAIASALMVGTDADANGAEAGDESSAVFGTSGDDSDAPLTAAAPVPPRRRRVKIELPNDDDEWLVPDQPGGAVAASAGADYPPVLPDRGVLLSQRPPSSVLSSASAVHTDPRLSKLMGPQRTLSPSAAQVRRERDRIRRSAEQQRAADEVIAELQNQITGSGDESLSGSTFSSSLVIDGSIPGAAAPVRSSHEHKSLYRASRPSS